MTENLNTAQKHAAELAMIIRDRGVELSKMQKQFNEQFLKIDLSRFPSDLDKLATELGYDPETIALEKPGNQNSSAHKTSHQTLQTTEQKQEAE